MTWLKGRGVAAVNYPTGMNLGGDPSQALVHATTTGSFIVTLASVDLGQGLKTVMAQICAETIGVPIDTIIVDTADTDTGPHCMGTFASRGTHRIGNAIIMAAKEARECGPVSVSAVSTPTPAHIAWARSPAVARTASATPSSWRRRRRGRCSSKWRRRSSRPMQ